MTLKERVANKIVRFVYYRDNALWYVTEDGFVFPVTIEEAGSGTFKAEDKAILFMRWIRKYMDEQQTWIGGSEVETFPDGANLDDRGCEVETISAGIDIGRIDE